MEEEKVRLNFDFPKEEYPYLKMMCAKKGLSFKELATALLLKAMEEFEEEELSKLAEERMKEIKEEDLIPWKEACKRAGWDV